MNTIKKIGLVSAVAFALFSFNACGDDSGSSSGPGDNGGDFTESSDSRDDEDYSGSHSGEGTPESSADEDDYSTDSDEDDYSSDSKKGHSSSSEKSQSSSSESEVPKSYAEAKVMPSGTYDCIKYKCFPTEFLNKEFLADGKYGEILDARDGQVYKVEIIGDQTWMAQNLNYALENASDYGTYAWSGCLSYSADSCAKYGHLYTWEVAMDKSGCGYKKKLRQQ